LTFDFGPFQSRSRLSRAFAYSRLSRASARSRLSRAFAYSRLSRASARSRLSRAFAYSRLSRASARSRLSRAFACSRLSRAFACSRLSRASGRFADQREARGCNGLCGPFRLHPLEEFAFGALHSESGFGVGLELSEAIQFRQCHLWL
jgi:hypothetical protein